MPYGGIPARSGRTSRSGKSGISAPSTTDSAKPYGSPQIAMLLAPREEMDRIATRCEGHLKRKRVALRRANNEPLRMEFICRRRGMWILLACVIPYRHPESRAASRRNRNQTSWRKGWTRESRKTERPAVIRVIDSRAMSGRVKFRLSTMPSSSAAMPSLPPVPQSPLQARYQDLFLDHWATIPHSATGI